MLHRISQSHCRTQVAEAAAAAAAAQLVQRSTACCACMLTTGSNLSLHCCYCGVRFHSGGCQQSVATVIAQQQQAQQKAQQKAQQQAQYACHVCRESRVLLKAVHMKDLRAVHQVCHSSLEQSVLQSAGFGKLIIVLVVLQLLLIQVLITNTAKCHVVPCTTGELNVATPAPRCAAATALQCTAHMLTS
jgi:hypothetical protein